MRRCAISAMSYNRAWSESRDNVGLRMAKDEKREIADDEEKHCWRLLKYNGTDNVCYKTAWLLAE